MFVRWLCCFTAARFLTVACSWHSAGDAAWKWFDQVVGEGRCPIVGVPLHLVSLHATRRPHAEHQCLSVNHVHALQISIKHSC
jgi:hypothetical protein